MANKKLIKNGSIVNEGAIFVGNILIEDEKITKISSEEITVGNDTEIIDANGLYVMPGMIDDQVHFREPGLTHKADIFHESRAAVAGGITSFMEMPNTVPNALTQELLQDKYDIAAETAAANYSFFMGASNDNISEVLKTDPKTVCGVKVFMGSSTGNMLVDSKKTLEGIFSECDMLIATHCEDEATVRHNMEVAKQQFGENVPIAQHPIIRDEEACYKSSSMAVELASKFDTRLHILHISTAKEVGLFDKGPVKGKKITAEACIHHLWFSDEDYDKKGTLIKWNPAVKSASDRDGILKGVLEDRIDVIATDHAPHTKEEKNNTYFKAPSGGPLVQHALVTLLEMYKQGKISLERIVEKTSHALADCFEISKRGYLREGYWADIVLVDLNNPWEVNESNILSKCGWSPFEGEVFSSKVIKTLVNGNVVYDNGTIDEKIKGKRILFDR